MKTIFLYGAVFTNALSIGILSTIAGVPLLGCLAIGLINYIMIMLAVLYSN